MDRKDASALWFPWQARPSPSGTADIQKLVENLDAIPDNKQKARRAKLRALHNEITRASGRRPFTEMYAAIENDAGVMVAARPAAKVGVELVGEEMVIRRKRLNATMQGNDEGTAEEVGVGGSSDIVPLAKRVRALSTPHKPTLPRTSVEFAKRKHSLASSVVFISRSTKDTSSQYQQHVDLMDEMHMKVFCPSLVTALFEDLSKMPMGHEVGKYLGQAMSKTFADGNEERIYHMALATTTDFYNMVRYKPNACIPAHNAERKYLVEQISPVLKMVEHTFGTISFKWIERHTNATKDINCMMLGTDDATTYAVDVIGVFGGDNAELLFLEQSGGSCFEKSRPHAKDDSIKVANESINGLRARLCKFLDVPVELAKKVRSYAMQLIANRLTLMSLSIVGPNEYCFVELKSACFPFAWSEVDLLQDICDLMLLSWRSKGAERTER
ncbi:hypothetical protein HDU89_005128 [Geranomyces variabilis]|nr:hypothetical protein HDU89_005128 [Geranomyces variabilis]